uniref:Uncharacterized protein n=1 Tax=Tanacetum cinerariifolium TaxID=118510 RepID=A0A699HKT2_TANCI|nr:hypothetical protein [Tanacetum cinerariifolium]
MSDSEHSTVSYTFISSDSDVSAWGIPLMDADEVPKMDPYKEVPELKENPKEDPIDYADEDDEEEGKDEESSEDDDDEEEEHLAPTDSTAIASLAIDPVPFIKETEPFETDESTATSPPPPVYRTTLRMSVRSQAPILFLLRQRADIPEADIPSQKRLLLTTPTPTFERDRAALRGGVNTLRRYLSSLCTTHEQERVKASHALARFESHHRTLEAWIAVLETQVHHHEWQRQDANDHATGHIMYIQALEAGARVDTLEDTDSSA